MKLDHSAVVLDYKGTPVLEPSGEGDPRQVTYYDLVMSAINTPDPNMPPATKARVFSIAVKFSNSAPADVSVEDAALIKEIAGTSLTPLGYGRVCEWIEAASEPAE